jgi:hypothetical protein
MTDSAPENRVEMTFRVAPDLRDRVKAYASRRGLSVNGVGNLALDEFLRAEEQRLGPPSDSASQARGKKSPK